MMVKITVAAVAPLLLVFYSHGTSKKEGEYPPAVKLNDMFVYNVNPWNISGFPLVNMKVYLQELNDYVVQEIFENSLVVVGPKDSGKSKGIQEMVVQWKKLGYTVFDINLKGQPTNVKANVVLKFFSNEFNRVVYKNAPFYSQIYCLRNYVVENCSLDHDHSIMVHMQEFVFNKYPNMSLVFGCIIFIGLWFIICSWVPLPSNEVSAVIVQFTMITGIFPIMLIFIHYLSQNKAMEFLEPLTSIISSGNWRMLTCTCNGINLCIPEHRPILIVREFVNFHEGSLDDLLVSLSEMKEQRLKFPVILETSDFFWQNKSYVIKSPRSFESFYVPEMRLEDANEELVNKYKMFSHEDLLKIYNSLGGHTGSYSELWRKIKKGATIDDALGMLKSRSDEHLMTCIGDIKNDEDFKSMKSFLCQLRENKYCIKVEVICTYVYHLLKCNVLFASGGNFVYPQKRLLQHAIESYLKEFTNNYTNT